MPVKKPKFYAVASGRQTGVFTDWDSCHAQVSGYGGSRYKAFPTRAEAEEFIQMNSTAPPPPTSSSYTCSPPPSYEPPSYAFATSSMSSSSSPSSLASTDFVSGVDQQRRSFTSLAADPSNVHGFDRNAGGSVRQRSLDASTWPTRMNNSQTAGNPNNSSCMSSTSGSSSATGNSGYSPKLGPKSKDGSKMPKSRTRPGVELGDPTSAAAFIDEKFSEGCVLMFTDGGASSNPGPSGSGVFIQVPLTGTFQTPAVAEALREYTAVELAVAIPKGLGTNNRAELEAMADAVDCLEYLSCVPARVVLPASSTESKGPSEPLVNLSNRTVHVFTDSKWVRGMLNGWKLQAEPLAPSLQRAIETMDAAPRRLGLKEDVHINWVRGHASLPGNERADALATEASQAGASTDVYVRQGVQLKFTREPRLALVSEPLGVSAKKFR